MRDAWCRLRSSWHCLSQRTVGRTYPTASVRTTEPGGAQGSCIASGHGRVARHRQVLGVLATFAGRSSSSRALFLSAGHCVNRGAVQISSSNSVLAVLADGEVLHRASYQRPLALDTGSSEAPRTCLEADVNLYATMTGGDILLLRLTETYDQMERRPASSRS